MNLGIGNKTKKIGIVIITLIILGIIFYYFYNGTDKKDQTSYLDSQSDSIIGQSSEEIKNNTSFLTTLLSLNKITIDPTLFSTTAFKSLKDNTVEIVSDGVVGRPNPFIPFDQQIENSDVSISLPSKSIPVKSVGN